MLMAGFLPARSRKCVLFPAFLEKLNNFLNSASVRPRMSVPKPSGFQLKKEKKK
jgi:hypothetical protein